MGYGVLFFYEEGNEKCMEVLDILEKFEELIHIVPCDVYDDTNLSLVDSWEVCCVPAIVFFPSYNMYSAEQITEKVIKKELEYIKNL